MTDTWMGCTTTISLVRQQHYTTRPMHGIKRPNEFSGNDNSDDLIFKGLTSISTAPNVAKRQCLAAAEKPCIDASRIYDINDNSSIGSIYEDRRRDVSSTPGPSQNPLLSLAHHKYGLPGTLVKNLASLGINSMYPWQSSCLLGRGLLDGSNNLVYTAPTGGGKSLVADILMLKRVIEDPRKKAILVLPYIALVQEKLKWLRRVVEGVSKSITVSTQENSELPQFRRPHSKSIRVAGFFGGSKARASWSDVDIAVCTIEKVF